MRLMGDETLFRLDGKTVAVVGAASGIGEAVAKGCVTQGAHVTCLDINAEAARVVATRIRESGGRASSAHIDIRDRDSVSAELEKIREAHDRLDVVISTPSKHLSPLPFARTPIGMKPTRQSPS